MNLIPLHSFAVRFVCWQSNERTNHRPNRIKCDSILPWYYIARSYHLALNIHSNSEINCGALNEWNIVTQTNLIYARSAHQIRDIVFTIRSCLRACVQVESSEQPIWCF